MVIRIMNRKELMELAKEPFPADVAVISITDSDDEDVVLQHQPEQLLRLKFDDVSMRFLSSCWGESQRSQRCAGSPAAFT